MKMLLIGALIFATGTTVGAQELKVAVRSDSEPLTYAYVYVNGNAAAVTDTLGVAVVPDGKWKIGDTLSASYVGTTPDQLVIDRKTTKSGECELLLSEMYTLTSDEVKVRADIEKLFRKTVRPCKPFYYNATLKADFEAAIALADGPTYPVSGKMEAWNYMSHYREIEKFEITGDTSDRVVARMLRFDMLDALCTAKIALGVLVYKNYRDKAVYGYLGKKDGYRIFRISYPDVEPGLIYQVMIWVGEDDHIIRRYEANRIEQGCITRITAQGVRKSKYSLLLCDHMLMPERIHAENIYANGVKTEFDIRNWRMALKLNGREVKFKD